MLRTIFDERTRRWRIIVKGDTPEGQGSDVWNQERVDMLVNETGELRELRRRLNAVGEAVNISLSNCVDAIAGSYVVAAQEIRTRESEIDELVRRLEGEARRLFEEEEDLAGQALRFVMRSLKITTDLERISDECHSLAAETATLSGGAKGGAIPTGLTGQAKTARSMVREALRALNGLDVNAAQAVIAMDDEADRAHRHVYREIRDNLVGRISLVDELIASQKISRALERVSDHAVNIAEDTIFIARGSDPDAGQADGDGQG